MGPLELDKIDVGTEYQFALKHVSIRDLDDGQLQQLSKQGQLYLTLTEMQTIQQHFRTLGREPTDIELETVRLLERALQPQDVGRTNRLQRRTGRAEIQEHAQGNNFPSHPDHPQELGADDWCVKVFSDNAGIVKFDDEYHIVFKVETRRCAQCH